MKLLYVFVLIVLFQLTWLKINKSSDHINISDYDYPSPNETDEFYTIAIVGTSDIHGAALKKNIYHPGTNQNYTIGGIDIMASQIDALKDEWKEKLLWLDGGDQFQGGMETKLSNGTIITDFLNEEKLGAAAVGNHEFDFGLDFLTNRMNSSNFPYLAANIETKSHKKEFFNNLLTSKIFRVGNINVGVIGLSTLETLTTTAGNLTNFNFLPYVETIVEESKLLKTMCHIIVLVSHIGTRCQGSDLFENKLRYFTKEVEPDCDLKTQEMNLLLENLANKEKEDNQIYLHAVVSGHTHVNVHHFIKERPVISVLNNGLFFNVMYLTFKKVETSKFLNKNDISYEFLKEKAVIEGPIPVCEKVFSNLKACYTIKDYDTTLGDLKGVIFHGKEIKPNEVVKSNLDIWKSKLSPYYEKLAYTEVRLSKQQKEDFQLGNFVTDCLKNYSKADISIINSGSFRDAWPPGDITFVDVYNMSPFGTLIYTIDITGKELKRMMEAVQTGRLAPYPISGFQVFLKKDSAGFKYLDTKINETTSIEDLKIYKMVVSEFLIGVYGDDFSKIKDWFKPTNKVFIGTDRDILKQCVVDVKRINKETSMDKKRIIISS